MIFTSRRSGLRGCTIVSARRLWPCCLSRLSEWPGTHGRMIRWVYLLDITVTLNPAAAAGRRVSELTLQVVALRAVQTEDFMTADWFVFPPAVLMRISSRITNEVCVLSLSLFSWHSVHFSPADPGITCQSIHLMTDPLAWKYRQLMANRSKASTGLFTTLLPSHPERESSSVPFIAHMVRVLCTDPQQCRMVIEVAFCVIGLELLAFIGSGICNIVPPAGDQRITACDVQSANSPPILVTMHWILTGGNNTIRKYTRHFLLANMHTNECSFNKLYSSRTCKLCDWLLACQHRNCAEAVRWTLLCRSTHMADGCLRAAARRSLADENTISPSANDSGRKGR
jgi:hypothetical protein